MSEIVDRFDIIGVDIPIGLASQGPRACDVAARRFLGARRSTVFPAPSRALLDHHTYAAANAASRELFGKGLSKQAFNLIPKIREVDALAQRVPGRFVEVHPECSFARIAGRVLSSKHQVNGLNERVRLVQEVFGEVMFKARGAAADDVLDAYAVLWSTQRFARGEHEQFGGTDVDELGIPMRIVS